MTTQFRDYYPFQPLTFVNFLTDCPVVQIEQFDLREPFILIQDRLVQGLDSKRNDITFC